MGSHTHSSKNLVEHWCFGIAATATGHRSVPCLPVHKKRLSKRYLRGFRHTLAPLRAVLNGHNGGVVASPIRTSGVVWFRTVFPNAIRIQLIILSESDVCRVRADAEIGAAIAGFAAISARGCDRIIDAARNREIDRVANVTGGTRNDQGPRSGGHRQHLAVDVRRPLHGDLLQIDHTLRVSVQMHRERIGLPGRVVEVQQKTFAFSLGFQSEYIVSKPLDIVQYMELLLAVSAVVRASASKT